MKYIFPYQLVEKGSKVILYGAGKVGYDFFREIKTTGYCEIVAWVDRQYEWCNCMNLPVEAPSVIKDRVWDKIVLAVEWEQTANDIRRYLNEQNIQDDQIVYTDVYQIGYDIAKKYSREAMEEDAKEAYLCHPREVLSEKRLDIIIRYLYAKDVIEGRSGGKGEIVYKKFVNEFRQAEEDLDDYQLAYFTEYSFKRGVEAFEESFKDLIASIATNGFMREGFVPLNNDGLTINGAHRLAAALALDKMIWVRKYPYRASTFYVIDKEKLLEHGFTDKEIEMILDSYKEMAGKKDDKDFGDNAGL